MPAMQEIVLGASGVAVVDVCSILGMVSHSRRIGIFVIAFVLDEALETCWQVLGVALHYGY